MFVLKTLENLEKDKRTEYNLLSKTAAIAGAGTLNSIAAFGGGKGDPIDPKDLLPFPSELEDQNKTLSDSTTSLVVKLYKEGKLPFILEPVLLELPEVRKAIDKK